MLTVVRRGPANIEKPTEIVRGQASRLPWAWDGLCFGVPLHESSRDGLRDIVHNTMPSVFIGGTWTRDNRGNPSLYLQSASNEYVEWTRTPLHERPTTELTAYVRAKRVANHAGYGSWFAMIYGWNSPFTTWNIANDSAQTGRLYGALAIGSSAFETIDTTSPTGTTEYVSVFLRWRSGEAPHFDVLGERGNTLFTTTHTSTITGSLGYGATTFGVRINTNEIGTTSANVIYSQALFWKRRLTDMEVSALIADPFGWYSPRRETIGVSSPYPLAFAGGEMKGGLR